MNSKLLKSAAIAALIAQAAAFILLAVFCAIAWKNDDPDKYLPALGLISMLVGGSVAGLSAALLYGERSAFCPIFGGIIYLLFQIIISLLGGNNSVNHGFLYFILASAGVLLASFLTGWAVMPGGKKSASKSRREAKKRYKGLKVK